MRKVLIIAIIILLLALDWAAFHDIFKGQEPNFNLEYGVIAASLLIFILIFINEKLRKEPL